MEIFSILRHIFPFQNRESNMLLIISYLHLVFPICFSYRDKHFCASPDPRPGPDSNGSFFLSFSLFETMC